MYWVKKHKLLAIKVIQHNSQPYIELDNLWDTLYNLFNSIQYHKVNFQLLDEIPSKNIKTWALFSREELINTIENATTL